MRRRVRPGVGARNSLGRNPSVIPIPVPLILSKSPWMCFHSAILVSEARFCFFRFSRGKICGTGNQDRGAAGVDGMALVDILRQLLGVGVQETVNLFMVYGVYTGFLRLGNGGGLVDLLAIGCRGTAGFVVEIAVHLFGPAGGGFADGVIRGIKSSPFLDLRGRSTSKRITERLVHLFIISNQFQTAFSVKIFWRLFGTQKKTLNL